MSKELIEQARAQSSSVFNRNWELCLRLADRIEELENLCREMGEALEVTMTVLDLYEVHKENTIWPTCKNAIATYKEVCK